MSKKVVRLGVADGSTTGCTMHDRPHEFEYKIGRWDAERSFTRPLGSAVAMLIALPCIASAQLFPFSPLLSVFLESCLLACLVVLCCFTPCDYTRCRFGRIFHFFFFCNLQNPDGLDSNLGRFQYQLITCTFTNSWGNFAESEISMVSIDLLFWTFYFLFLFLW